MKNYLDKINKCIKYLIGSICFVIAFLLLVVIKGLSRVVEWSNIGDLFPTWELK